MKRVWTLFLAFSLSLGLVACGTAEQPPEATEPPPVTESQPAPNYDLEAPPSPPIPLPPTEEDLAAQRIDKLLESMPLEKKVGQLFFVRCPAENAVADVETYHLGGYLLFGRDFKDKTAGEIIKTIDAYQQAARGPGGTDIPLLIGVDEEGGSVVRVSSNPHLRTNRFPAPQKVLRTPYEGDPNATYNFPALSEYTHEKDILLKGLGINVNFAPVVDVATDSDSFIYDRTFGVTNHLTAEAALTMVGQMSGDKMGSVLKHFPGYGDNGDTHTGIVTDHRGPEVFTAKGDLYPFFAHRFSNGTSAILVSHNIVEAIDPDLPASLSPAIHDLLRQEVQFDGVALTDDLAMEAVAAYSADGAVAVMALAAGNDMIVTTDYRTQIPKVLEAVENGTLTEETIDIACRRVLTWKQSLGLIP